MKTEYFENWLNTDALVVNFSLQACMMCSGDFKQQFQHYCPKMLTVLQAAELFGLCGLRASINS